MDELNIFTTQISYERMVDYGWDSIEDNSDINSEEYKKFAEANKKYLDTISDEEWAEIERYV